MFVYKLLLIVLLIPCLFSLKRSEIGAHDWSIKTVGSISDAAFLKKERIAVLNEEGELSYINRTSGNVISRVELGNNDRIFKKGKQGGFEELYFSIEKDSVIKLSLNDDQQKFLGKISQPIIEVFCRNSVCAVITTTSIVLLNNKQLDSNNLISLSNGKFISAFEISDKKIGTVEYNGNQLCSRTIEADTILVQQNKHCINASNSEVHALGQYTIVTKNKITTILDSTSLQEVIKSQGEVFQVLPKSTAVLLKLQNGLKKLTPKNNRISEFSLNGYIRQTTKGTIFSIVNQNKVFFLQLGNVQRISWVSESQEVVSAWVNQINQLETELLVQYSDLRVQYYVFEVTTKVKLTPRWVRQEALSNIQNVLFIDYQNEKQLSNSYYETLLHHHETTSFISLYISRLSFQIQSLISGIKVLISDIISTITNLNINQILKGESSLFSQRSESDQKYFGMRKIVLASSSRGIIFALDSKTSKILWKSNVKSLINSISSSKLYRMVSSETQKVIVVTNSQTDNVVRLFDLDWKTGAISKVKDFKVIGPATVYQIGDNELGIKDSQSIQYYNLQEQQSKHSFIFSNSNQTHISCQSILSNNRLFDLWSMTIPNEEQLITLTTSFRNDIQSKLPLFKDNVVYLKNVDYTNFAVLTRVQNSNVLNLYVLNGQNGHILLHKYKKNIDFNQQINLAYDENTILVSYFNSLNKMFEIWTIEQYKDKTYTSVGEIISQYFKGENSEESDHSHQKIRNNIMVFETVFGSPLTIKNMYVSTSKLSLIKRNIYIITQKNQIYSLNRRLINTRRPSSQSPIENQKYPPYEYLIPINPTQFITYSLNLDLNHIEFSPTALESTFLLLAVGKDLFMTRCSPDGTFDMITDSFNYPFLISVVVLATIILQFLKRRVKKARIAKSFLN